MKRLIAVLVAGLAVVPASTADGLTLSSVDGTWSNLQPPDVTPTYQSVPITYGNGVEQQVRWGVSDPPGGSGLGFAGVSPPLSSFVIGEAFEIGQLRHFNVATTGATPTSADLALTLMFSDPAGLTSNFDFTFNILEMENTGPVEDWDDFIYFPNSYPPQTFEMEGTLYTLQLLGFGDSPTDLADRFRSTENSINDTLLWGRITPAIPAPGAMMLGALGTGLVGWLRRRRAL